MDAALKTARDMVAAERELAADVDELDHTRKSADLAAFVMQDVVDVFADALSSTSKKTKGSKTRTGRR
ncbi:hypothetical protein CC117_00760 [Parafrankia colletiae]|uniref:Uncharacterized protein n=2 Tax=Parafrankia colletiae TaxID=573497 RepID=A0A1S1RJ36_9ACTN|nr:hypothetical protein CC117_00760 [Parafrankia colletiae]